MAPIQHRFREMRTYKKICDKHILNCGLLIVYERKFFPSCMKPPCSLVARGVTLSILFAEPSAPLAIPGDL